MAILMVLLKLQRDRTIGPVLTAVLDRLSRGWHKTL